MKRTFTAVIIIYIVLIVGVSANINEKVGRIIPGKATREQVVEVFGKPDVYRWKEKTFSEEDLPDGYVMIYKDVGVAFAVGKYTVWEVRVGGSKDYSYEGKIRLDSSVEDVISFLGEPSETITGEKVDWDKNNVLYRDIEGNTGYCYIHYRDIGIRIFFSDYKVSHLYLCMPADSGRGAMTRVPTYDPDSDEWQMELIGYDLSGLDLNSSLDDLLYAHFDTRTIWPTADKMPKGYDWKRILELGKNPGLGVRRLHAQGITGRGVGIAIMDQPLLAEHHEYKNRLKLYEGIDVRPKPASHGAAVAAIAVGETAGVAPGADLFYFYNAGGGTDYIRDAQGFRRILEINEQLSQEQKIRVISVQTGWRPEVAGYDEIMAACEEAKAAGMLVVSSSIEQVHGFKFHGLGRFPLADPDAFESYEPGMWWAREFYAGKESKLIKGSSRPSDRLLIPMDSRTTASASGVDEYVFYRRGGWSWSTPYIAGVYALAAQVDPAITPERFWSLAMKTGKTIELEHEGQTIPLGPIVDPVALINALRND